MLEYMEGIFTIIDIISQGDSKKIALFVIVMVGVLFLKYSSSTKASTLRNAIVVSAMIATSIYLSLHGISTIFQNPQVIPKALLVLACSVLIYAIAIPPLFNRRFSLATITTKNICISSLTLLLSFLWCVSLANTLHWYDLLEAIPGTIIILFIPVVITLIPFTVALPDKPANQKSIVKRTSVLELCLIAIILCVLFFALFIYVQCREYSLPIGIGCVQYIF